MSQLSQGERQKEEGTLKQDYSDKTNLVINRSILTSYKSKSQSTHEEKRPRITEKRFYTYLNYIHRCLAPPHIHNFYGQITINELTLKNPFHNQSILKSIFLTKVVKKAEVFQDYVSLMTKSNQSYSDPSYIIQRFNSFGDEYFHKIANSLALLSQFFTNSKHLISSDSNHLKSAEISSQIASALSSYKGKAFFAKILPNEFLFSFELLNIMGKIPQEFAKQCLQYRSVTSQIFTSENYRQLLERGFDLIESFKDVIEGKIKIEQFLDQTNYSYIDTIIGQNQKRIKVKISTHMPNPYCVLMVVDEVLGEESPNPLPSKTQIQQQKSYVDLLIQQNLDSITKITKISSFSNQSVQNDHKIVCTYKKKNHSTKRKNEDYDYMG